MKSRIVADTTAVVLSAYLPYIWHDNPPSGGNQQKWYAVAAIWKTLRPSLEEWPGGIEAAEAASTSSGPLSLGRFAGVIAGVFDNDAVVKTDIENLLAHGPLVSTLDEFSAAGGTTDLVEASERLRQQILAELHSSPVRTARKSVPACQVCGKQDASLRVVVYPWVASMLFITARRAFSGLWCRRHAVRHQVMASLITATVGWMGIPFGLIFTPLMLWKLIHGGDQPADINRQMLIDLAQHFEQDNHPREAVCCLEAALEFGKSSSVEAQLRDLYLSQPPASSESGSSQASGVSWVLLVAVGIGLLVGILNYLTAGVASAVVGNSTSLFVAILTWVPLVASAFLGGILLTFVLNVVVRRTRLRQIVLGIALAVLTSLAAAYMIPTGDVLAQVLFLRPLNQTFVSGPDALRGISWILTQGGLALISNYATSGETWTIIYLVILVSMAVLYLVASISLVRNVVSAQSRVSLLREPVTRVNESILQTGFLPMIGLLTVFVALGGASLLPVGPDQSEPPPAAQRTLDGLELMRQGDYEGARVAFEEAQAMDRQFFFPYIGFAYLDMTFGDCDQAMTDLDRSLELSPDYGYPLIYMAMSSAYSCQEDTDAAIAAAQKALELYPEIAYAHLRLGLLYADKGDFETAAEYLTIAVQKEETAEAYAYLAIIYYEMGEDEKETSALQGALDQPLHTPADYFALAAYYARRLQFSEAADLARSGSELAPRNLDSMGVLAGIDVALGRYDEAVALADQMTAVSDRIVDPYLIRSGAYFEQGMLDEALEEVELAAQHSGPRASIHSQKAGLLLVQGAYEEAIREAQAALEIDPYNSGAYTVMALAHLPLGHHERAYDSAQHALLLFPTSDLPYYVLGVYYMDRDEDEQAVEALERFLELTWDYAFARSYAEQARAHLQTLNP